MSLLETFFYYNLNEPCFDIYNVTFRNMNEILFADSLIFSID